MTDIGKKQRKARSEPEPERASTKKPSPARALPERFTPLKRPERKAPGR